MATIFPNNPTTGDTYNGYIWTGTAWDITGVDLTASYQPLVASVSSTELGYLDGVTSSIQTQLNSKQATVSGVSDTEIGYLDGVTSAIQTQIDGKVSKTGTNTVSITTTTDSDPIIIESKNQHGGAGYAGITQWTNTYPGTNNPNKYWRLNNNGELEIVNSAYSAVIFSLDDLGNLNVGSVNGTTINNNAWNEWTPSLRTNGGSWTIGNGSIDAAYKVIGKTCHISYKITIGSTTSIGSGELIISLPLTAKNSNYNFAGSALDNGNAWYSITGVGSYLGSTTEFAMIHYSGTGKSYQGLSNSSMFSLLSGDYITLSGTYEVA